MSTKAALMLLLPREGDGGDGAARFDDDLGVALV